MIFILPHCFYFLLLKIVLSSDASNSEALYYTGISHQELHEDHEAIPFFEKVMKQSRNAFCSGAKWHLSKAYMNTNQLSKAKKLLQELSAGTSEYKANASALLDSLSK